MNQTIFPQGEPEQSMRTRMMLLVGQGITLGALLSLLFITSNALFLTTFGSQVLPYVYITVALLGTLISSGFASLQKRWTLPSVIMMTTAVLALFFLLCWAGLALAEQSWLSFPLIAAFPLFLQLGFVILGSQAGRLLDLRQIKRLFPQVVTGFVIGFIIGGALAPILVRWLGSTVNVLLPLTLITLVWLVLEFATSRQFPDAFQTAVTTTTTRTTHKSLRQLLAKRFVLLLFVYQMAAAMVYQFSDYLLLAQAGARYPTSEALAQFFSSFTILLNSADLFFLFLLSAYFLRRFGLRGGLLANPLVGMFIFALTAVVGLSGGPSSSLFFGLIVMARVLNITLTDGTTRTSVNAAYQALPESERIPVQTGAEGIGGPLALGLVGIILLVFNTISGLTIMHTVLFTLLLALLWAVIGFWVYRDYASELLHTIRRRALGEAALTLDDPTSLEVIENLLKSDEPGTVRLALDMLETAVNPDLDSHLCQLLTAAQPLLRLEALSRIERRQVAASLPQVIALAQSETDTAVKSAAIRAWCALDEIEIVENMAPFQSAPEPEVRRAVMVGLLRYGGISGVMAAGTQLHSLEQSANREERLLAAQVIGEVASRNYYQPLLTLLQDEDPFVRQAALTAAGQVGHPRLLPLVVENLAQPANRSAALTAVQMYGEAILPTVNAALQGKTDLDRDTIKRLVRVCGQIKGTAVIQTLHPFLDHADSDIRHSLLLALNACGYRADAAAQPRLRQILQLEASDAAYFATSQRDLAAESGGSIVPAVLPLQRALEDELTGVRQRMFLLLSFLYDARAMLQTETRFISGSGTERSLGLELLDVTLSGEEKALLFPLLDAKLSKAQQAHKLGQPFGLATLPREARLQEMIANENGRLRGWVRACAVYAAGKLGSTACTSAIEGALADDDARLRETAVWALYTLSPESYQRAATVLAKDASPQVRAVTSHLARSVQGYENATANARTRR